MFLCLNVRDYVDLFGILSSAVRHITVTCPTIIASLLGNQSLGVEE